MKKAKDANEAWDIQQQYDDEPHGWIQWKGTNVCMDVHCACDAVTHVDATFCYYVKCSVCGRVYFCNGHIEFIELEEEPDRRDSGIHSRQKGEAR